MQEADPGDPASGCHRILAKIMSNGGNDSRLQLARGELQQQGMDDAAQCLGQASQRVLLQDCSVRQAAARGGGLLDDSAAAAVLGARGAAWDFLALVPLDPVGVVRHWAPAPTHYLVREHQWAMQSRRSPDLVPRPIIRS